MTYPYTRRGGKYIKVAKLRKAKGGIKVHAARRNIFGSNWWSKRWSEVIEATVDASRISRGKTYARKGQVVDISIEPGLVSASVQGTRKTPYLVRLGFRALTGEEREIILCRFRENAGLAAKLLVGEMPEETEAIFKEAGAPLFPTKEALRRFKCSCPDPAMPCKHIVAVLLIICEEIANDPFLLLRLRGLDKNSLIKLLTMEYKGGDGEDLAEDAEEWEDEAAFCGGSDDEYTETQPASEELSLDGSYFKAGRFGFERAAHENARRAAALDVMNDFPFWRGERPFRQMLEPFYTASALYAAEVMTGERRRPVGRPKKLL